jgi:hypothetical protein
MNKRIKELAEQAGFRNGTFDGFWIDNDGVNRFAELIVRECLDIADGQKKYVEDMEVFNEQDATWNKARIQQSQQIVDKIKQHFGVEE